MKYFRNIERLWIYRERENAERTWRDGNPLPASGSILPSVPFLPSLTTSKINLKDEKISIKIPVSLVRWGIVGKSGFASQKYFSVYPENFEK